MPPPATTSFSKAALKRPAARVFKSDRRSRVWLVHSHGAAWVIKRFEYARLQQILALALGLHPAQREIKTNFRLREAGLRVVPIEARGVQWGRAWLATREHGPSLQTMLREGRPDTRAARNRLIGAISDMCLALLERGWFFRDLKVANIVVDAAGRPWLIDADGRRSRRREHAERMLRQLYDTARVDGLTRTDAWRAAKHIAASWDGAGDAKTLFRGDGADAGP